MILIAVVVVVIFGANKLPKLGEGLGKSIRGFQRAVSGADDKPAVTAAPTEPPKAPASGSSAG